jgi:hypothetical protein
VSDFGIRFLGLESHLGDCDEMEGIMETTIIEGGCFCGDIRYRATQPPGHAAACHCQNCRHANAAPFAAFVAFGTDNFETDKFRFIKGKPVRYRYTSEMVVREGDSEKLPVGHVLWSERWFCGRCGTQIAHIHEGLTDDNDETRVLEISVPTCTLDDPNAFPPQWHEMEEEKLSWVKI